MTINYNNKLIEVAVIEQFPFFVAVDATEQIPAFVIISKDDKNNKYHITYLMKSKNIKDKDIYLNYSEQFKTNEIYNLDNPYEITMMEEKQTGQAIFI